MIRLKYNNRRHIDIENHFTRQKLRQEWLKNDSLTQDIFNDRDKNSSSKSNKITGVFEETVPITFKQYKDMPKHYSHPMENVVNGIIEELIQKVLIELNVIKLQTGQDSRILINDEKLQLIVRDLIDYDVQENGQGAEDRMKEIIAIIKQHKPIILDFNDLKIWYNYYQSGEYLNYVNSETMRFIKGYKLKFTTVIPTNEKDLAMLKQELDISILQDKKKLEIILRVIKLLVKLKSPPTVKYFKVLLDELLANNLLHYANTIIKYLIKYDFSISLLAEKPNVNLLVEYYKPIIEEEPEMLDTFINYHFLKKESDCVQTLMAYLKFDEIITLEKVLYSSKFQQLISMSRFTKNRLLATSVNVEMSRPLRVSCKVIYNIIDRCIDMKKFEYIDLLVNKLLFHSIKQGDSIEVILSINENINLDGVEFIIDTESIETVISTVFTPELVLLLLKCIQITDDMGRLMWLIPNLDIYILTSLQGRNKKLPGALVLKIYRCLKEFGLDGKLQKYEKILGKGA